MNTLLRARDIEAYALSTLTIPRDSPSRNVRAGKRAVNPAAVKSVTGNHRVLLMRIILGIAAAAIAFGFVSARISPSTAHGDQGQQIRAAVKQPRPPLTQPAIMKIVPADVLEPSSSVFIGTGDGGNGSWIRQ